ncbi:hypothetical protein AB4Y45_33360 [Paraburkholderia sp. EG287A]|uniref:hypothetical protein n=1 Tax=Paraburkholderia sp. EG287A TaxID=3237012 RepID=UPI0034D1B3FE
MVVAAALMCRFGAEFFRWWMHDAQSYVFITATSVLSPTTATAAGMQMVGGLAFAILCVGAGLLASAVLYSFIDDVVTSVVSFILELPNMLAAGITWLVRRVKHRYFPVRRIA